MKRNKNKVILSSIVVLLPMVIGLLIWNQLPKDVATHFGFNGQPDGICLTINYICDSSFLYLCCKYRSKIQKY